jgi:hypothetical protein
MVVVFLVAVNVGAAFLPVHIKARSSTIEAALVIIFAPTAVNVCMNAVALLKRMWRFINEDRANLPRG